MCVCVLFAVFAGNLPVVVAVAVVVVVVVVFLQCKRLQSLNNRREKMQCAKREIYNHRTQESKQAKETLFPCDISSRYSSSSRCCFCFVVLVLANCFFFFSLDFCSIRFFFCRLVNLIYCEKENNYTRVAAAAAAAATSPAVATNAVQSQAEERE